MGTLHSATHFVPPRVSMATKGFLYLKSRNITFNAAMSFESFWLQFLMYPCNCVFACNWEAAASAALQGDISDFFNASMKKNKSSDDSLYFSVNCSNTVSSIRFSGGKKTGFPSSWEIYITAGAKDVRKTRSGEPEAGPPPRGTFRSAGGSCSKFPSECTRGSVQIMDK